MHEYLFLILYFGDSLKNISLEKKKKKFSHVFTLLQRDSFKLKLSTSERTFDRYPKIFLLCNK